MLRAGTAAAGFVLREYPDILAQGVALLAGPGNNGGDAYVIAAQLARAGIAVRLHAAGAPRTEDAQRAAELAAPALRHGAPTGRERLVIDGLLGTGHSGALRGDIAGACTMLGYARDRGAVIVALDVPTGLDATTGEIAEGSVAADVSLAFGTVKRGHLLRRDHVGRLVLLDIGLARSVDLDDAAWHLASERTLAALTPPIAWNAHKGSRGHLTLVGGAAGMAGAIVLAARGALASGAGLVKALVARESVPVLQQGVTQALAGSWPDDDAPDAWPHAIAIGPGLGRSDESRRVLTATLAASPRVPLLLDADALTIAAAHGGAEQLRAWGAEREHVVCTPHPGEFARLVGERGERGPSRGTRADGDTPGQTTLDWQQRADALVSFAIASRATMLLKGTPTLVATPDGAPPAVIPRGTPLLATGGSGDVLSGIIGALLAEGVSARDAALLGASVHGLAAELVTQRARATRGSTLADVLDALPDAWRRLAPQGTLHGAPPHDRARSVLHDVLLELPSLA